LDKIQICQTQFVATNAFLRKARRVIQNCFLKFPKFATASYLSVVVVVCRQQSVSVNHAACRAPACLSQRSSFTHPRSSLCCYDRVASACCCWPQQPVSDVPLRTSIKERGVADRPAPKKRVATKAFSIIFIQVGGWMIDPYITRLACIHHMHTPLNVLQFGRNLFFLCSTWVASRQICLLDRPVLASVSFALNLNLSTPRVRKAKNYLLHLSPIVFLSRNSCMQMRQ
jgi:hypothetical protein